MRVTQASVISSLQQKKSLPIVLNDENNPRIINQNPKMSLCQYEIQAKECLKTNSRLSQIRRQYLHKIQQIEQSHSQQIISLKQKLQRQKSSMIENHKRQLVEKQEYIKLLEEMVSREQSQGTFKSKGAMDSKMISISQFKSPVPFFEDLSNHIDFKIERQRHKKHTSLGGFEVKHRFMSSEENRAIRQSSKHKLTPKGRPSEAKHCSTEFNFKLPECQNSRIIVAKFNSTLNRK